MTRFDLVSCEVAQSETRALLAHQLSLRLHTTGIHNMVSLVEVNDSEDWSDASSVASSSLEDEVDKELSLYDPSQETLRERLAALKDIVPPSTRASIQSAVATSFGWAKWTGQKAGTAAWIVTTSALVVGLPLMLSIEGEAAIVAQEKGYLGGQAAAQQAQLGGQAGVPAAAVPAGF